MKKIFYLFVFLFFADSILMSQEIINLNIFSMKDSSYISNANIKVIGINQRMDSFITDSLGNIKLEKGLHIYGDTLVINIKGEKHLGVIIPVDAEKLRNGYYKRYSGDRKLIRVDNNEYYFQVYLRSESSTFHR